MLERLLTYGPRVEFVAPNRSGSSSWSCRAKARSRRGRARRPTSRTCVVWMPYGGSSGASTTGCIPRSRWAAERLAAFAAVLFDRMTEMVLFDPAAGAAPVWPRAAQAAGAHLAGDRTRRAREGESRVGPRVVRRRDRVPARKLQAPRPRAFRRRAHDVRAGELRALPP